MGYVRSGVVVLMEIIMWWRP